MKDFRDLKVWEKAHELTMACYAATTDFPKQELFGLVSQIRRSACSVPANIAEGCGRRGNAELHRILQIAMGSASELEYHLLLSHDLKFLKSTTYDDLQTQLIGVKRMLAALLRKSISNETGLRANHDRLRRIKRFPFRLGYCRNMSNFIRDLLKA